MVDELRKISEQKFGTKFYFTMYPGRFHNFSILIPELEKRGISYLDYSAFNFGLATRNRNVLPIDTHPTSLSHFLFAKLLTDDLKSILEKTNEK
jgi:hypothetical protein